MFQLVLVIHLLLCVALIAIILKQQGKGADMGAAFGSAGGSNTIFGSAGMGNVLVKMTVGAAIIFMITSIILARGHTEFAVRGGTVDDPTRGTIFDRMIDEPVTAPPLDTGAAPDAEGTADDAGANAVGPATQEESRSDAQSISEEEDSARENQAPSETVDEN